MNINELPNRMRRLEGEIRAAIQNFEQDTGLSPDVSVQKSMNGDDDHKVKVHLFLR